MTEYSAKIMEFERNGQKFLKSIKIMGVSNTSGKNFEITFNFNARSGLNNPQISVQIREVGAENIRLTDLNQLKSIMDEDGGFRDVEPLVILINNNNVSQDPYVNQNTQGVPIDYGRSNFRRESFYRNIITELLRPLMVASESVSRQTMMDMRRYEDHMLNFGGRRRRSRRSRRSRRRRARRSRRFLY